MVASSRASWNQRPKQLDHRDVELGGTDLQRSVQIHREVESEPLDTTLDRSVRRGHYREATWFCIPVFTCFCVA